LRFFRSSPPSGPFEDTLKNQQAWHIEKALGRGDDLAKWQTIVTINSILIATRTPAASITKGRTNRRVFCSQKKFSF